MALSFFYPHTPDAGPYLWIVVVSDVGDIDGKLMIAGVDVHAMIFLIALMFYSPTSSLARGPPISEDLKCARWKVGPIQQWRVYLSMRVRLR